MAGEFAYRSITKTPVRDGSPTPSLDATGYALFSRVSYDQKTWFYGLLNPAEFGEFMKWASGEAFGDEIENGADINLVNDNNEITE